MKASNILITEASAEYALLDSGEGEKLERFGTWTLARPDPQALWSKQHRADWKKADGSFARDEKKGEWSLKSSVPERWEVSLGGLKFWIRPSSFKHVGLFPEQSVNWEWLAEKVLAARPDPSKPTSTVEVLNLFGYTGGATLAAAKAGANVVHIDGSKVAMAWARENAELSGLGAKPIRWIVEDARTFVKREVKRGRLYDGIIMDPPAFGHGPNNELWKIEDDFLPLLEECMKLLKPKPLFFLVNGYSAGYSALAYENALKPLVDKHGGTIEIGELAIKESGSKDSHSARLLPAGIFARWSR